MAAFEPWNEDRARAIIVAEAGRPEVALACQQVTVPGHPDERCAHPALGDQLVHRRGGQQIAEVAGQCVGSAE